MEGIRDVLFPQNATNLFFEELSIFVCLFVCYNNNNIIITLFKCLNYLALTN